MIADERPTEPITLGSYRIEFSGNEYKLPVEHHLSLPSELDEEDSSTRLERIWPGYSRTEEDGSITHFASISDKCLEKSGNGGPNSEYLHYGAYKLNNGQMTELGTLQVKPQMSPMFFIGTKVFCFANERRDKVIKLTCHFHGFPHEKLMAYDYSSADEITINGETFYKPCRSQNELFASRPYEVKVRVNIWYRKGNYFITFKKVAISKGNREEIIDYTLGIYADLSSNGLEAVAEIRGIKGIKFFGPKRKSNRNLLIYDIGPIKNGDEKLYRTRFLDIKSREQGQLTGTIYSWINDRHGPKWIKYEERFLLMTNPGNNGKKCIKEMTIEKRD